MEAYDYGVSLNLNRTWIYFFFLALANAVLAYSQLPTDWKIIFGFLSLGPLVFAALIHLEVPPPPGETFKIPPWLWVLGIALLLFTRFACLTSVPFWPIMDEGRKAYFAMGFLHHWEGSLLWGESQIESLFIWALGLFFKVIPPSLLALRLFPALLSLLTAAAAYWAARQFFGRTFAFLCFWGMAFSFWPFTFSRLCMRVGLFLLMECLALGLLGYALRKKLQGGPVLLLGFTVGLGFHTYTAWPVVALFLALAVGWSAYQKRNPLAFVLFLASSFLLALPWAFARLHAGGMGYPLQLFHPSDFFKTFCLYLAVLFWNGFASAPFGPNWGGFLNPLLGATAVLGVLTLNSRRNYAALAWGAVALFLALLPGALTETVEPHRITAALPGVVLLFSFGLESLLLSVREKNRAGLFACLFVSSMALDTFHFLGPYQDWKSMPEDKKPWRSLERFRAYGILRSESEKSGPIAVLDEFSPHYADQTLKVAVYPFDHTLNPKLSLAQSRWTAVLVNCNYEPFLKARFPSGRWVWLVPEPFSAISKEGSVHTPVRNGGLLLGLIPRTPETQPVLEKWLQADEAMGKITWGLMRHQPGETFQGIRAGFQAVYPAFQGDPFLESVYWERRAQLDAMESALPAVVEDFRQALARGYPAPNLYNEMGYFLEAQNQRKEALEAYQKAVSCPVNHTSASARLQELKKR